MIKAILQNPDYSNSDCKNQSIVQIHSHDHDWQKRKGFHIVSTWYAYATINISNLYVRSMCTRWLLEATIVALQ